jgi:hypothetical protein
MTARVAIASMIVLSLMLMPARAQVVGSAATTSPNAGAQANATVVASGGASVSVVSKWKFKTGGSVYSTPLVAGGIVYFGSYDYHFYAADAATGKEH